MAAIVDSAKVRTCLSLQKILLDSAGIKQIFIDPLGKYLLTVIVTKTKFMLLKK